MNIFFEEHQQVLKLLQEHEVRYMLVGGYAVIYYGYHRTTGDMDLWIASDGENISKFQKVLLAYGIEKEDVAIIGSLDYNEPQVFSVGEEPTKVDFLTRVNLVKFDQAYANCKHYQFEDNIQIYIIQYRDLILTKINTGRIKDAADIEELQKKNRNKKDE